MSKSLYTYIYRFLKRNSLSIRAVSHIGQLLPIDSIDLTFAFLKEIINIRIKFNITPKSIVNMNKQL